MSLEDFGIEFDGTTVVVFGVAETGIDVVGVGEASRDFGVTGEFFVGARAATRASRDLPSSKSVVIFSRAGPAVWGWVFIWNVSLEYPTTSAFSTLGGLVQLHRRVERVALRVCAASAIIGSLTASESLQRTIGQQ